MANGAPPPRKVRRARPTDNGTAEAATEGHVDEDPTTVMEAITPGEQGEGEAAQVPNAVLVVRDDSEPGKIKVALQTMGDVRLTEVEKLLKTALKQAEEQLG